MKCPILKIYKPVISLIVLATLVLSALVSCGGATSDLGNVSIDLSASITLKGVIRDSNVSGLKYVTPTKTGVTGEDGGFEFQVNEFITFSIGGVTVGTAKAKTVITPVDFATDRSTDSVEAKNIARFLLMLDEDGDPDNGIVISQQVQDIAVNWSQVDFTTSDLDTALITILSDVNSVDDTPPIHTLPDDATAKNHMETTLLCTYGGAFRGQFAGDDRGHFGFNIEANVNRPNAGLLSGFLFSEDTQQILNVNGLNPVTFDSAVSFANLNGNTTNGRNINLRFSALDQIDGNWSDPEGAGFGTLSGGRIGGGQHQIWHFVGKYTGNNPGDDSGVLSFSLIGSDMDSISGEIYSMNAAAQHALSGVHEGSANIDATSADGKRWLGLAILDPNSSAFGVMSGEWADSNTGQTGTFNGTGCKRS